MIFVVSHRLGAEPCCAARAVAAPAALGARPVADGRDVRLDVRHRAQRGVQRRALRPRLLCRPHLRPARGVVRPADAAARNRRLYARLVRSLETEQEKSRLAAEQHRRIFDTSLDLILITDKRGRFIQVSPSSMPLLGYRPEEMIGRIGAEFIFSQDLDRTRQEMRLARRGREMRNFETRYLHKDGRIVMLSWTGVWSEPALQHFFIGRDITESKKAQEALKAEIEERKRVAEVLHNTITSMVDPVLVADAKGKLLIVNPAAQRIFGRLPGVDSDEYTCPTIASSRRGDDVSVRADRALSRGSRRGRRRCRIRYPAEGTGDRRLPPRRQRPSDPERRGRGAGRGDDLPRHDREQAGRGGAAGQRADGARHHRHRARRLRADGRAGH